MSIARFQCSTRLGELVPDIRFRLSLDFLSEILRPFRLSHRLQVHGPLRVDGKPLSAW